MRFAPFGLGLLLVAVLGCPKTPPGGQDGGLDGGLGTDGGSVGPWSVKSIPGCPGFSGASARIAMLSGEEAVVVWTARALTTAVMDSSYRRGTDAWSTPDALYDSPRLQGYDARLVSNGDDEAMAVWFQDVVPEGLYIPRYLMANRYAGGIGWLGAEQLTVRISGEIVPGAAMNAAGDARVGWREGGISTLGHHRSPDAWDEPAGISIAGTGYGSATVALDSQGNGMLIWQQDGKLMASRCQLAGACGAPETVADPVGTAEAAVTAVGADQWVFAWLDGTGQLVARVRDGATWASPVILDASSAARSAPTLAANDTTAILAWKTLTSSGSTHVAEVWTARWTFAGGWSASERLDQRDGSGDAFSGPQPIQLAVSSQGHAVAAWSNVLTSVLAARYQEPTGWSPPDVLKPASWTQPAVAVSASGDFGLVWAGGQGGVTAAFLWAVP